MQPTKKISQEPSAVSLAVTDYLIGNQTGPNTKIFTLAQLAAFVSANLTTNPNLVNPTISGWDGWQKSIASFTYGANNGSKEFVVVPSSDLTSLVSPGMHAKYTRSVTPPTQCMAFIAASSQLATKASPSNIIFTSAFTTEAWVYLNSYTGNVQTVINRFDGAASTGGWRFSVSSSGQLALDYGTTTTFTTFLTYASIPVGQWVHIAAVVTSTASKTGAMYINGASVPFQLANSAATSLTQAAVDLRLGSNSATNTGTFFNGFMSEVRLWSAAQTQAAIQANMAISLTGSESNLVALFQGNGVFTDKTANANNLTATGAIATQLANPYNAVEYFTVIALTSSSMTFDGGSMNNLPNQTLGVFSFSTEANPVGLPVNLKKYRRTILLTNNFSTASTTYTQWLGMSQSLTIPAGATVYISGYAFATANSSGSTGQFIGVYDGTVPSGTLLAQIELDQAAATFQLGGNVRAITNPTSAAKTYNLGVRVTGGTGNFVASIVAPAFLLIEVDI